MIHKLRNEKGLTLAELLATIAVGSLIMILITSMYVLVQKQYKSQSADARHLTDVSIAVKDITKGIRSAEDVKVNSVSNILTIQIDSKKTTYELDEIENILRKNNSDYIYDVDTFIVELDATENRIDITIKSETGQKIETHLFLRGG